MKESSREDSFKEGTPREGAARDDSFREGASRRESSRGERPRRKEGANVGLIVGIIAAVGICSVCVLAVLMALLVPAVQKVREAAARTQTNNNMRLCAIAIHNYHGTFHRLPSASGTGGIYKDAGQEKTMWFHLLPFVEADNVYKADNHDAAIPAYLAPSDPYIEGVNGKLNYAANIRLFGYDTLGKDQANNAVAPGTGMPSGQSLNGVLAPIMKCGLMLSEIKDGTSNVFMLATRYGDCGGQSTFYSASPTGTMLAGGAARAGKGGYFGAGSHDQPADRASIRAIYQVAPRRETCLADDSVFGHSFSAGGMSVALCDASIKSIDPNLTPATFCRALCPSDGFPLDNDWNGP